MADVLKVGEEVSAYRGRGAQSAAWDFSYLFRILITGIDQKLGECDTIFSSFADARRSLPSELVSWDTLEKLAARARACIQGPRSRSRHTSDLRADAWKQLGRVCELVGDPAYLVLSLEVAANPKKTPEEREGAVDFLRKFWGDERPNEATANLLRELENDPPSRSWGVSVLQAQIDLGLNDEFGGLDALDEWDDTDDTE